MTTFEYYLESAYLTCEHIVIQGFFFLPRENQNLSFEKMKIFSLKKKVPVNIQNCLWFYFSWQSVRGKTKLPITREKDLARKKTQKCTGARKKVGSVNLIKGQKSARERKNYLWNNEKVAKIDFTGNFFSGIGKNPILI